MALLAAPHGAGATLGSVRSVSPPVGFPGDSGEWERFYFIFRFDFRVNELESNHNPPTGANRPHPPNRDTTRAPPPSSGLGGSDDHHTDSDSDDVVP